MCLDYAPSSIVREVADKAGRNGHRPLLRVGKQYDTDVYRFIREINWNLLEKDQLDAQFYLVYLFILNYPLHVREKQLFIINFGVA